LPELSKIDFFWRLIALSKQQRDSISFPQMKCRFLSEAEASPQQINDLIDDLIYRQKGQSG